MSIKFYRGIACAILAVLLCLSVVSCKQLHVSNLHDKSSTGKNPVSTTKNFQMQGTDDELNVYFLDVGQGDCALLVSPNNKTMLIDVGESNQYTKVALFLESLNINSLDAVVATHPHSDHIGGMENLINDYDISAFYMPDVENETKTYDNMMNALDDKNIEPTYVYGNADSGINWDEDVEVQVLSPLMGGDYGTNLNNYSVMLKVTYGDNKLIFTGDSEETEENFALNYFNDLDVFKADVLKVAHHGSNTGTSHNFLTAVDPDIAIVSVAWDNSYGHPHSQTLDLLDKFDVQVLRTDENGTIHLVCDKNGCRIDQ